MARITDGPDERAESIDATRRVRRTAEGAGERPAHPALAATLLMVGIVVALVVIAAGPLLTR
jgi:hypothetical protein